jgi:hypothetical protein
MGPRLLPGLEFPPPYPGALLEPPRIIREIPGLRRRCLCPDSLTLSTVNGLERAQSRLNLQPVGRQPLDYCRKDNPHTTHTRARKSIAEGRGILECGVFQPWALWLSKVIDRLPALLEGCAEITDCAAWGDNVELAASIESSLRRSQEYARTDPQQTFAIFQ